MGINFEKKIKGKVGDIVYPAYNGTNGFFQTPRWDVVTRVDDKGNILDKRFVWDIATIKAIEIIQDFPEIITNHLK